MLATPLLGELIPFRRPEQSRPERPEGLPYVPIALDDLQLSLEAFRVFGHLGRKARFLDGIWKIWESLETIGRICFLGSFPNAKAPSLRIRTKQAIDELEAHGMVEVTRDRKGNTYKIMPQSNWRHPGADWKNPNKRGRRSQSDLKESEVQAKISGGSKATKKTPKTPTEKEVQGDRPIDPLNSSVDLNRAIDRSGGDHNGITINGITSNHERESVSLDLFSLDPDLNLLSVNKSNASVRENFDPDTPESIDEYTFEYVLDEPIAEQNPVNQAIEVQTISMPEAIVSPTPPKIAFDTLEEYDWSQYSGKSDKRVPRAFWDYMVSRVEVLREERLASDHPDPIVSVESYTRYALRHVGAKRYRDWLKSIGQCAPELAPTLTGIHWGEVEPVIDEGTARSLIRTYWRELQLSWDNADLLAWMDRATAFFEGFRYDAKMNFYTMPEAVLKKLCSDLEATVRVRLGVTAQ